MTWHPCPGSPVTSDLTAIALPPTVSPRTVSDIKSSNDGPTMQMVNSGCSENAADGQSTNCRKLKMKVALRRSSSFGSCAIAVMVTVSNRTDNQNRARNIELGYIAPQSFSNKAATMEV